MGALRAMENPKAIGTISMPTIKMTKTVGPSPASSIEKSAWHASQRGANSRKPLKRLPSLQTGHRPLRPVCTGGNLDATKAGN